jgi:membrane-bound lytic murein transglycosylase D
MKVKTFYLAMLLAILGSAVHGRAMDAPPTEADAHMTRLFPRPAALEPQIAFWHAIFAEYSSHQVVLHDAVRLDKVYKVLDFRPHVDAGMSEGELAALERIETDLELDRVRATLLRLHALGPQPASLTADERHIFELFADDPAPDRFLLAADEKRLHSQRGLRERFGDGVRASRRYLPEMERIFREEGLPPELTRLPLIESCFNLRAYSKVGAAGIWQFMPKTGRLFMRVDQLIDERRDPISSTRAAAQFLSRVHDQLDSWPLAITAYNHGPDGIARAVDEVGSSDIATIIRDYRGKSFGFASRNFYAEFLAALDVEHDGERHFGPFPADQPLHLNERRLERAVGIEAAARLARTDRSEIAELNPALSPLVVSGRRPIPAGYKLRLPASGGAGFESRLAEFAAEERVTRVAAPAPAASEGRIVRASVPARTRVAARPTVTTHRVRRGQTLSHIARAHRVSVQSLKRANRLGKSTTLRTGQVLKVVRDTQNET